MAKPNYQFEKRQRELEKKKKKAEKASRKAATTGGGEDNDAVDTPESGPVAPADTDS